MHTLSTDVENISKHISATNNLIYYIQSEALHRINNESIARKVLIKHSIQNNQTQIVEHHLHYQIQHKNTILSDKIKKLIINIKKEVLNLETNLLLTEILENKSVNIINTKEEYNLNNIDNLINSKSKNAFIKNILINVKDCKNNYQQLKTPYETFWTEKISNKVIALDVPNLIGKMSIAHEPYITYINEAIVRVNFNYQFNIQLTHPENIFIINFER